MRVSPRSIVFPLLILIVALGLTWWTTRQTDATTARIQATVAEWCNLAAGGEDPAARIPAQSFMSRPLGEALVETCKDALDRVSVEAASGPGPGRHAVKATHHVVISRDGAPVVGINFLVSGDQVDVVGYWKE